VQIVSPKLDKGTVPDTLGDVDYIDADFSTRIIECLYLLDKRTDEMSKSGAASGAAFLAFVFGGLAGAMLMMANQSERRSIPTTSTTPNVSNNDQTPLLRNEVNSLRARIGSCDRELSDVTNELTLSEERLAELTNQLDAQSKRKLAAAQRAKKRKEKKQWTQESEGREVLKVYYDELMSFKDKDDFHYFGFGIGGPYNVWHESVQTLRNKKSYSSEVKVGFGELWILGSEYMHRKGRETESTRLLTEFVNEAIQGSEQ